MAQHLAFTSRSESAAHTDLLTHLQTALHIEYSTVPIYLFTYYSINRRPSSFPQGTTPERIEAIKTFANTAGGIIMSIAVEEMLHMALASNLLRALGGMPDLNLYRKPSTQYPTPLPHHNPKADFKVPLSRFSDAQLSYFLGIERPEDSGAPPEGDNWDTIGQFYAYIRDYIHRRTTDADFGFAEFQLAPKNGYYSPNNIDTIYPSSASYKDAPTDWNAPSDKGAKAAIYTNVHDSGDLFVVRDWHSAKRAIGTICEQGEGYKQDVAHEYDDKSKKERSHWYKFSELERDIKTFSGDELASFVFPFMDNPTREMYAKSLQYDYRPLVDLANAAYTYIFQMTQASYKLCGAAQYMMFNIGMHKGMIFVLDKIISNMRHYYVNGDGTFENGSGMVVAPTFENYPFESLATAKKEMIALFFKAPPDFQQKNQNILHRMQDLPDVNVREDGQVRF
ncbi:ferritin-like domain-containing protein [Sorangium sp. So ce1000]|uniref:ferritin-like domain-containing protein n=1 Tax=Sorangium sp. So ce1000 TaxID=3133325 RepID=UPI003F62DD2A